MVLRSNRLMLSFLILLTSTALVSGALSINVADPSEATQHTVTQLPELRIIGWTVLDERDGNNDGGLHPGETALLQIFLSNQGNEPAHGVMGVLSEAGDHPDVEILDKSAMWGTVPGTGAPVPSTDPHFKVKVATTRPCEWEIDLQLTLTAEGGYYQVRKFTLVMVDPRIIDLAQSASWLRIHSAIDFFSDMASGDIDGDGYDEIVLGESSWSPEGRAAIVFDVAEHLSFGDIDLASPLWNTTLVYGRDSGDGLGAETISGDFNGDGYDDVALSAPGGDGPDGTRANAGEVTIVYGGPYQFGSIDLASPPPEVALSFIYGVDSGDVLATWMHSDDLDNDGYDDLVLSTTMADGVSNTESEAGEVVIVYGDPEPLGEVDLAAAPLDVAFIHGADMQDWFGRSMSGDLDGDGYTDLIAGSFRADGPGNNRFNSGEIVLLYGDGSRMQDIDLASPPPHAIFLYGAHSGDGLGGKSSVGDFDGDGYDDLAFPASTAGGPDDARTAAGEVNIHYGGPDRLVTMDLASSEATFSRVFGVDSSDRLGRDVEAGDLNGDGYDDLIVGSWLGDGAGNLLDSAGEITVLHGGAKRFEDVDLASAPPEVLFVYGATANDQMYEALPARLGLSGLDDLVVLAVNTGTATVIPGRPSHSYRYDDESFAFIDASAGTDLGLACDDCSITIPIGFGFHFFGKEHDSVTVSSNGYLTFGGPGDMPGGGCPPSSNPPNDVIAVLWDDLDPSFRGKVYSLVQGEAPYRRLTIEWNGFPLFPDTGDATFEVTLFESTDQIVFQYEDTYFGNASDHGATAVVGLENATGNAGVFLSCFAAEVPDMSAKRLRSVSRPTEVWRDDMEVDTGEWTAAGLWHRLMEPTCAPSSHSGEYSWYYGQDPGCTYDTGTANSGSLTSALIPNLAQDASLRFWERRVTTGTWTDSESSIEVEADGGGFTYLRQLRHGNTNGWEYTEDTVIRLPSLGWFVPFDLAPYAGSDFRFRFLFESAEDTTGAPLGWMVDDVSIEGCPVHDDGGGRAAAAEAHAIAAPPIHCEGETSRLDALGSYCTACPALTYQWHENGTPIEGATAITYITETSVAPGDYDYTMAIDCTTSDACARLSDIELVTVVGIPMPVGPTLTLQKTSSDLEFHWTDSAGATEYVLLADSSATGSFNTELGRPASGGTGIVVPMGDSPMEFYLVAGSNPTCGLGPLR